MLQERKGRFAAGAIAMIALLQGSSVWGAATDRAARAAQNGAGRASIRYQVVDRGAGFQVEPVTPRSAVAMPASPTSVALGQAVHLDAALLELPQGGRHADR